MLDSPYQPIVTALRKTVKSYISDTINQKSGYIRVVQDSSTVCSGTICNDFKQPSYYPSRIGLDLLFRDQSHFNVIHWNQDNIRKPSFHMSLSNWVTRIYKHPYHIATPKVHNAFDYPFQSMSPVLLYARCAPTVTTLDTFLAAHITYIWGKGFSETAYASDLACSIRHPDSLSLAPTSRKAKLI